MILKPNMVLAGLECPQQHSDEDLAAATVDCLLRVGPAAVPGIAFLSGGPSARLASARLNALIMLAQLLDRHMPWALTFSFGRAIQAPALEAWQGKDANVAAAQDLIRQRVR